MKIYDISQEVFSCNVFPGTPGPERTVLRSIPAGDRSNLTLFSMCAHNGTHIDAPFHFLNEGAKVDQLALDIFVGACYVTRHEGNVTAADAASILERAAGAKRLLLAGDLTVTEEAAAVFAKSGLLLLGNESQSVGPVRAPVAVHKILLGAKIALLEGIVLKDVPEGRYFLNAAPLNLGGADGAPCRAWLMPLEGVGL